MIRLRLPAAKHEWVALVIGLGFAVGSAVPLVRGVNSLAWLKADGVITYMDYKPGPRVIGIDVKYRYSTSGRTYTGDRYRFQFFLLSDQMDGRDAELTIGRYPAGERVQVRVNPRDPADSVLVAGPDLEGLLPLGAGLLMILFAVGEARKPEAPQPQLKPVASGPRYRTAKILAAVSALLFLLGARYVYQGVSSTAWPVTDGRIIYSRVRSGGHYETLLWYEYYVGKQRYVAGNYRAGGNSTPFQDVAKSAAKRYSKGQAVRVYYNPSNPGEALLEPGAWYGNFVAPAIALLVLAAAWLAKKYAEATAHRVPR